jgi:hypothetical protein
LNEKGIQTKSDLIDKIKQYESYLNDSESLNSYKIDFLRTNISFLPLVKIATIHKSKEIVNNLLESLPYNLFTNENIGKQHLYFSNSKNTESSNYIHFIDDNY